MTKKLSPKLILLDRDGVINEDVGSPGVTMSKQLQLTPNAGHAIGKLKRWGYKVAIITNQSCVGKGLISADYLKDEIMPTLQAMLLAQDPDAIWDDVFVCTTTTRTTTDDHRRKPSPGMIQEACAQFGVHPEETAFVGDTLSDMQAAQNGGVSLRILVSTGYGKGIIEKSGLVPPLPSSGDNELWNDGPVLFFGDDDNKRDNGKQGSTMQQSSCVDKHDNQSILQAIMPFVYANNLEAAVEFIMEDSHV